MVKLLALLLLVGCGQIKDQVAPEPGERGRAGADGADGEQCTVQQINDGAVLTCPDGSTAVINDGQTGAAGTDGQDGVDGQSGTDCSVEETESGSVVFCEDGSSVIISHGQDGKDGKDGQDGLDGTDGADGQDGKDGLDNTLPVYVGYFCSRTVIRIGKTRYVINSQLVPLSKTWYYISSNCEIRYKNGKVETQDPTP